MDTRLILAIVTMTLALVFYSTGVWSEHRAKSLKRWHVLTFWAGLAFDTTGTLIMGSIARAGGSAGSSLTAQLHGITGALAIALMIIHAVWALTVLLGGNERRKADFHRFSLIVWAIWLVPYLGGMVIGMA